MHSQNRHHGFTLIELSMVLVIIGLLVGGILIARDMIHAAAVQKHLSQLQQFNTATNAFDSKYGCLPGDCPNAKALGFTASPAIVAGGWIQDNYINGDGQGDICNGAQSDWNTPLAFTPKKHGTWAAECINYWWHLSQAGLINWTPTSATNSDYCNDSNIMKLGMHTPSSPLAPGVSAGTGGCAGWAIADPHAMNRGNNAFDNQSHVFLNLGSFANYGGIPAGTQIPTWIPSPAFMTAADALYIDSKIDDGAPNSGTVRAIGPYQDTSAACPSNACLAPPWRGAAGLAVCVNTTPTPNVYNVANEQRTCNLSIEAAF